jgi:hypothetical protein
MRGPALAAGNISTALAVQNSGRRQDMDPVSDI